MKTPAYPLTILLLLVTPACLVESPPPPPVESPPPQAEVAGTWSTPDGYTTWIFGADGSFMGPELTDEHADAYEIDGNRMRFAFGGPFVVEFGFAVTEDRLLIDTLEAQGPIDGVVGMWRGTASLVGGIRTTSLELMADGTVTKVKAGTLERGTWLALGETLRLDFPGDETERWYQLGDRVIGELLFTRVVE